MGEQTVERVGWLKQLAGLGVDRFDAPGIYLGGTGNIFAGGKHYLGPHSIGKILSSKDQSATTGKSAASAKIRCSRRFSSPRQTITGGPHLSHQNSKPTRPCLEFVGDNWGNN